jgi:transcriptional regulator GlxA family with amidase domain
MIAPDATLDETLSPDIVLVPGISSVPEVSPADDHEHILDWIRTRHAHGSRIVSACTGALILAEAGLLDGKEATTHWAFREHFRKRYPRVRLRIERNLCLAADGIVTSGGTTAWQHLALFLIDHYCGRDQALRAAKFWLLTDAGDLQSAYAAMPSPTDHDDSAIRECQTWIQEHYGKERPVEAMIEIANLPPTSFARRFRRATSYSPIEYVHAIRIDAAKAMLEMSEKRIEAIGQAIGYEDAASFRRLFRRQTGLAPREYRRLFGQHRFAKYEGNSAKDVMR